MPGRSRVGGEICPAGYDPFARALTGVSSGANNQLGVRQEQAVAARLSSAPPLRWNEMSV